MSKNMRNAYCQRLRGLGLSKELTFQILDTCTKWCHNNGLEWTTNHIKAMKTDYVRYLAGQEPVGEWYSKRSNGAPKGPFGALWDLDPQVALTVLEVTSVWHLSKPSEQQRVKFESSVQKAARPIDGALYSFFYEYGQHLGAVIKRAHVKKKGVDTLVYDETLPKPSDMRVSPERRMPVFRLVKGQVVVKTVPESDVADVLSPTTQEYFWRTWSNHRSVRGVLDHLGPSLRRDVSSRSPQGAYGRGFVQKVFPVGKISFIQEPSCKLRAVANPFRLFQVAMTPLGDHLSRLTFRIPADCTKDQHKGVLWAQELLAGGNRMFSVDLSDATNNFPLEVQVNLLKGYGASIGSWAFEQDVETFKALSRSPWAYVDRQGKATTLSWSVGQPLGLRPSFPSFALAHHALVYWCDNEVNGDVPFDNFWQRVKATSTKYKILGDDIVISDPCLYERYRWALDKLDCKVSESKTLVNAPIAEFAGRVVTPNRILRKPKWRQHSDDSFMEFLRAYGPRGRCMLRSRQRRVVDILSSLPVELGGLGWNPQGASLDDRISSLREFLFRDRNELRPLVGSVKRFAKAATRAYYSTKEPGTNPIFDRLVELPWAETRLGGRPDHHSRIDEVVSAIGLDRISYPEPLQAPKGFTADAVSCRQTLLENLERALGVQDNGGALKTKPSPRRR